MSETPDEAAILAALDTPIRCGMRHPIGRKSAIDCDRKADWIATVHHCHFVKATGENTRGVTLPICAEYLGIVKTFDYPSTCLGCGAPFTSILDIIWDLQHINPA